MKFLILVFAVFLASMAALLWTPEVAHAQCTQTGAGGFVPLECFQRTKLEGLYTTTELGPFIQRVFVGAIALGAMLAVLRLAWAGFIYMGSDMWSKKDHAKEIIRDTMLGLFLLLAVWVILRQINPDILKLNVVTPPIPPSAASSPSTAQQTVTTPGGFLAPNQDPSLQNAPSAFTSPDGNPISP